MADPLDGATAQPDPLAQAQPVSNWKSVLAAATGLNPILAFLNTKQPGRSVLDETTRGQALKDWVQKNLSPAALAGESQDQADKEGIVKTAGKAYVNVGKDVLASTPRFLSHVAQGAVNTIGGIGSAAVNAGTKLGEAIPGGPSDEDVAAMQRSGQILSPQDVSNATASLAAKLRFSQNPESILNQPSTLIGGGADLAKTLGTYALAPEAGAEGLGIAPGLARRAATMTGLGAQGFGTTYQAAQQAGLPSPGPVATGAGLTNAFLGGLGYTSAFEPQAGKLLALLGTPKAAVAPAAAALTSVPEAALATAMQGRIAQNFNPQQPTFSGQDFLANLAMIGGLKTAGKLNYQQQAQGFHPSYEFPSGRPSPSPIGGQQAPFDLESQLFNLRSQQSADTAVANNLTSLFKGVSPEAREELSHYYSDLEAGLQPKPLAPEARAVANNPAWQSALKSMSDRYTAVLSGSGQEGVADPNHIPRIVTEGVEATTGPKGAGALSQTDQSIANRQFFALQDDAGRRVLVSPGPQGKPGEGAAMAAVGTPDFLFAPNGDGTYGPDHMQLKQASINEIESQTPVRYRKDAISDLTQGILGMGRVQRNLDFLSAVKGSPLVSEIQTGKPIPPGYTTLSTVASNAYPALKGYAMEPGLAQAFEAAAKRGLPPVEAKGLFDKVIGWLGDLGKSAVNVGFGINPLAHSGFNMPAHALDAAIKFGGLNDPSTAVGAFSRASDAVMGLRSGIANQDMVDYLNAGGTLMSARKLIQTPREEALAGLPKSVNEQAAMAVPSAYDPLSQPGMKGMTDLSTHLTWTPDDTARMGLAFLLQDKKGLSLPDAVQEANKTYPDYRNYMNRLSGMPATNQLLNSFNRFGATNFANYEMKASGILGRNFLDLVNPNILGEGGTRMAAATGLGTKVATYAGLSAMMGALIQSLTHDPRSEFGGAGSGHLMHQAMQDYEKAGGGIGGAIETVPTLAAQRVIPNALTNLALSLMHRGYGGREPVNPTDSQDAWLNLKSVLDPALHGELDQAKQAMDEGALDDAKRHMSNLLQDFAKNTANSVIYNGGDMANLASAKTDAASVLTRAFLRGTRGGTDAELAADTLSNMRSNRFPPNANQVARGNDKLAYALALKQQDWDSAEQIASRGNLKESDLSKLQDRFSSGDRTQALAAQVATLPYADAVRVFANGTAAEKEALYPIIQEKLDKAYSKLGNGAMMPTDPAQVEEMYRSGPFAQYRESKRIFDFASASMPNGSFQNTEPLADAQPLATPKPSR